MRAALGVPLLLVAGIAISGCFAEPADPGSDAPLTVQVGSIAFLDGQPVPRRYTCEGQNVSPPLALSNLPAGTAAIALVMDDPDAPSGTFTHWTFWDLQPERTSLAEGANVTGMGASEGTGTSGRVGYRGPCPPEGHGVHHYRFKVYAQSAPIDLPPGASVDQLAVALEGHVLARGVLVGTYSRG